MNEATPTRRPPVRLICALAVGGGLTLAACGGSGSSAKANPQTAVQTAVSNVGAQSSLSTTFSIGVSAANLKSLLTSGGSGPTQAQAQAISSGSIFFSEQTGHGEAVDSTQAATDKANSYDFGLTIGSSTPVEIRYVGQAIYARVQATTLASDLQVDQSKVSSLQADLQRANQYVPGASALANGSWVELSPASLQSLGALLKQYEASAGGGAATSNPGQLMAEASKLRKDIVGAVKTNSTFASAGGSGGRDEYDVTLNVANFVNQVVPLVQSDLSGYLSSLPGGEGTRVGAALSQAKSKVPAGETAVMNVAVSGNKLAEVDLDLNQFAKHKASYPVPLKMVLGTPPAISAPAGATQLDLSKLPQLLQGLAGGSGSSASPTSTPAAQ